MNFDLIAIDGDDTLWENEAHYRQVRGHFQHMLSAYGKFDDLEERLDHVEIANLPYYGYGSMSFTLSLIETAIELTGGGIRAADIRQILELGKGMIGRQVVLLEGAAPAVAALAASYPLMLITKGDLRHQQAKIEASGLQSFFEHVEVVSDKTPRDYQAILERHGVRAESFLMVGNSLRSDILPVLELGGWAVYIPNHLTWTHEQVQADCMPGERCFEIRRLDELPELVERLQREIGKLV